MKVYADLIEKNANLIEENKSLVGKIDNLIVSASADQTGASVIVYQ